jgi:hypothetical protein
VATATGAAATNTVFFDVSPIWEIDRSPLVKQSQFRGEKSQVTPLLPFNESAGDPLCAA